MKVFVTGGSGLVGSHTARALLDAGHQVRLLVRSDKGICEYFERFGHRVDDLVVADMRDQKAVAAGLSGCDAVFHAAALVSVDPRRAKEIYQNNVAGIDSVLGAACRQGIDRVLYVSSLSVLFQKGYPTLTEAVPLGTPTEAYARSKRDCDEHVRDMQARGLPIQITYPAGIIGPDDPKLSEANHGLVSFLKIVPQTSSGIQFVDVRDLAAAHVHLLEHPPQGGYESCRYIVGGPYYDWAELRRVLEAITGRKILGPKVSPRVLCAIGNLVDAVRRIVPFDTQVSREAMGYVTEWVVADSSRVLARTGVRFRPGEQAFADTIRWLVAAGHLQTRYAGKLLARDSSHTSE
jgi:nucleoside-diphosphate-sugar epimerase